MHEVKIVNEAPPTGPERLPLLLEPDVDEIELVRGRVDLGSTS